MADKSDRDSGIFSTLIRVVVGLSVAALAFSYFFDAVVLPSQPGMKNGVSQLETAAIRRLVLSLQ
jgi:hypothetical protein